MQGARQGTGIPVILFGAFDRHNFGDLLFSHIASMLLDGKELAFAGLAQRDLRAHGGHRVGALAQLAASLGDRPVDILHVGGELLTCDAWQAAVMLLPVDQARDLVARFDAHPGDAQAWAHRLLGTPALAPYTVSRSLFPHARRIVYDAVGGVELDYADPAMRAEVLANLKAADAVGVRDRRTHALLRAHGIAARLIPDPAAMVADLFGAQIRRRAQHGEVGQLRAAFPQGYIAVQFSADFGDDDTLAHIAAQLERLALARGFGIACFRAGAAPWHDELACYERLAARMRAAPVRIVRSLDLWDICALLASSRAYCGSSLHGRIVAMAFALPRVNLRHPSQGERRTKQEAYAETWEEEGMPVSVGVHAIASGMEQALGADGKRLEQHARELAALYRQGFDAVSAGLGAGTG